EPVLSQSPISTTYQPRPGTRTLLRIPPGALKTGPNVSVSASYENHAGGWKMLGPVRKNRRGGRNTGCWPLLSAIPCGCVESNATACTYTPYPSIAGTGGRTPESPNAPDELKANGDVCNWGVMPRHAVPIAIC